MKLRLTLLAACLLLSGCELKYDETIECDGSSPSVGVTLTNDPTGFTAKGIYAYKIDVNTWLVMYPNKDFRFVPAASCIVTGSNAKEKK